MRNLKTFAAIAFLLVANAITAQSSFDKWPALKDFHQVMSNTFHPAEEGDFIPLKALSQEMQTKATMLLTTPVPEQFTANSILSLAEKIQLKSKALHKLVLANASDAVLLKSVTDLHETFHQIVGECNEQKK